MLELNISPDFTVDDIHKVREYNYEKRKNMTAEERKKYYSDVSEKAHKRMIELKKARMS